MNILAMPRPIEGSGKRRGNRLSRTTFNDMKWTTEQNEKWEMFSCLLRRSSPIVEGGN